MFTHTLRHTTRQTRPFTKIPITFQPIFRSSSTSTPTSPLIARLNAITKMSSQSSTPKITSLTDLPSTEAKWIKLQKATYTDAKGKSRVWELASRKTTGKSGVDAVAMGNIIYHPTKPPSTILVIQFRPPVNAFTIEWPAGLIDEHETAEEAAVRELYEETGYHGKVVSTSPAVSADPGMSSANMKLCMVEIRLKEGEPEPEQHLEEGEEIQRVNVPLAELYDRLEEFAKEGYVVAAKLYHWAAGVKYAVENPELFKKGT
ncbi:NUDIX hydrolase domain-like protein [Paraphoma chrysanthemicola]|uniref:NUDIX hydrolase domain-like protein n=1 Tax=Paraphoma chrysanthemicola TaxID=798071 RepID=A0A8K0R324_9PLEO|nr:NUDIX hydrolase domain-like protein [Paraphoma chrysanthemicola]